MSTRTYLYGNVNQGDGIINAVLIVRARLYPINPRVSPLTGKRDSPIIRLVKRTVLKEALGDAR